MLPISWAPPLPSSAIAPPDAGRSGRDTFAAAIAALSAESDQSPPDDPDARTRGSSGLEKDESGAAAGLDGAPDMPLAKNAVDPGAALPVRMGEGPLSHTTLTPEAARGAPVDGSADKGRDRADGAAQIFAARDADAIRQSPVFTPMATDARAVGAQGISQGIRMIPDHPGNAAAVVVLDQVGPGFFGGGPGASVSGDPGLDPIWTPRQTPPQPTVLRSGEAAILGTGPQTLAARGSAIGGAAWPGARLLAPTLAEAPLGLQGVTAMPSSASANPAGQRDRVALATPVVAPAPAIGSSALHHVGPPTLANALLRPPADHGAATGMPQTRAGPETTGPLATPLGGHDALTRAEAIAVHGLGDPRAGQERTLPGAPATAWAMLTGSDAKALAAPSPTQSTASVPDASHAVFVSATAQQEDMSTTETRHDPRLEPLSAPAATDARATTTPASTASQAGYTQAQASAASAETARAVAMQIAVNLPEYGRVFELALHPDELGSIRIALSTSDAGSVLLIQAERPETLDLMRRHVAQLEQDLRTLGHDQLTLQFAHSDGRRHHGEHGGSAGPPQGDRGSDPEVSPASAPRHAAPHGTAADRLDIRL